MDWRWLRAIWVRWAGVVALVLGFILTGCEGGEGDLCGEVRCGLGEVCINGVCYGGGDGRCEPECGANHRCELGRCVASEGGCDYAGQACSWRDYGKFFDEFLCMDWEGGGNKAECSQDCRSQGCPQGDACYLVSVQGVEGCQEDGQCLAGQFCYQGSCSFAACRPAQCDLPGERDERCPSGMRCEVGDGGMHLCVQAGTRRAGEACLDGAQAQRQGRSEAACVEEAACINGVCRAYCQDESCVEDQECVGVAGEVSQEVRICVKSCTFGAEETGCDDRETCVPLGAGRGVCEPAGELPAFSSCEVGQEGCEPGTICAAEESGESFGRCLPVCDLSLGEPGESGELSGEAQRARDRSCPQREAALAAWTLWHLVDAFGELDLYINDEVSPRVHLAAGEVAELGEAGHFELARAGQVLWALRKAGAAATDLPLVEGELSLKSGESQVVSVVARPGDDRGALVHRLSIEVGDEVQWFQGIDDLEIVDVWGVRGEMKVLLVEQLEPGELKPGKTVAGIEEVELRRSGSSEVLYRLAVRGSGRLIALRGTVDPGDLHPVGDLAVVDVRGPDLMRDTPLKLSCRSVNGGTIGACVEVCDGLEQGRCQGEQMGCGPRHHQERARWTTVCQPVGDGEEGQSCDVQVGASCGEGLYCQAVGGAESASETGVCSALCEISDQDGCPIGQGCRPLERSHDYGVGECRVPCFPDGRYTDPSCPEGLQSCRPESSLIPLGDGINTGYDVQEEQPFCWPSGSAGSGMACGQGQCVPGHECLYERSRQGDLVSTLLSPYFSGGGATPTCRPICDPFDEVRAEHRCGEGETCLFNHPWNADVGHCAPIVEQREPGEGCDEPGLSCGRDSICVIDGGPPTCMRFCQFLGSDASGYAQSSCPTNYECAPFVEDIGLCRATD